MKPRVKKILRTAQTRFPSLKTAKDFAYLHGRRLLRRPHDRDFSIFARLRNAHGTFVDVGANHGQSIESLSLYRPQAAVVSFEANPHLAGKLRKRYARRGNVEVHAVGLGDKPGEFVLFTPVYNGFVYDGLASLSRREAEGWLNESTLFAFDRRKLEIVETPCRVETLDSFKLAPAAIKIDVQGYEYNVVKGARETIGAHRPLLLIEGYAAEPRLREMLQGFGYEEYRSERGRLARGRSEGANSVLLARAPDEHGHI